MTAEELPREENKKEPGARLAWRDIVFALAIALGTAAFVSYYVGQELPTAYFSDLNFYHIRTWSAKESLLSDPVLFPFVVLGSTAMIYNLLFTPPLVPFLALFGDNRSVFITALALVYQLPYLFFLAWILKQLVADRLNGRLAFWLCVIQALAIPTVWAPTLRGYPDFAPSAIILFAACIYLKDTGLNMKRTIVSIGLCLAFAPVMRRHFFYQAFALALAILVHQFYLATACGLEPALTKRLMRWGAIGLVSVAFLCSFGFLFLQRTLSNDYLSLYQGAYVSFLDGCDYFLVVFGLGTWLLASMGMMFGVTRILIRKEHVPFILTFTLTSVLVWPLFGRHVAIHYAIYAIPYVVLGSTLLLLTIFDVLNGAKRLTCSLLVALQVLINLIVASGSRVLHQDTIWNCRRKIRGRIILDDWKLMDSPILDTRDALPLEALLSSRFVIVASPVTSVYRDENANIVRLTEKCFAQNWEVARDFKKLPERFKLENNTTVSVYERLHPTSPQDAIHTLKRMLEAMPIAPGGQPAWISSNQRYEPQEQLNRKSVFLRPSPDGSDNFLLSYKPMPKSFTISGAFKDNKQEVQATCILYDDEAREIARIQPRTKNVIDLNWQGDKNAYAAIFLSPVEGKSSDELIEITNLKVTQK